MVTSSAFNASAFFHVTLSSIALLKTKAEPSSCISVMVASLIDLVRWTFCLRKSGSELHVLKGGEIQDEIKALSLMYEGIKISKSMIVMKGYAKFKQNKKYIITINFPPKKH